MFDSVCLVYSGMVVETIEMPFEMVGEAGARMIFPVGMVSHEGRGNLFSWVWGWVGQCNVTYRDNVALIRCGCSIPAAERWTRLQWALHSQHTQDASPSFAVRCGDVALPKLLWDFLLYSSDCFADMTKIKG